LGISYISSSQLLVGQNNKFMFQSTKQYIDIHTHIS
jgi:hypothetical protein